MDDDDVTIVRVDYGTLVGQRPRAAGSNARLGPQGAVVRVPLLRLTAADGSSGFGACFAHPDQMAPLLGQRLSTLCDEVSGVGAAWLPMEYALWDLRARRDGRPVYALLAALTGRAVAHPYRVPCYDTSLYMDDLHLSSDEAGAALIAAQAHDGYARGHRTFKVKVGRGARHMPVEEGTRRDIAVIRAVRAAIGPQATLLLDANNGYTLNLTKAVLEAVAACRIGWLEEPFHEDPVLYRDLHAWMERRGYAVRIADGEGDAAPQLLDWVAEGLIDVVQYDLYSHGLTRWLSTGQQIERSGTQAAPHHYGTMFGNYAACHLAVGVPTFAYVEWDDALVPGLDASGYSIEDGVCRVPDTPGFGLSLDEALFQHAVTDNGFMATV